MSRRQANITVALLLVVSAASAYHFPQVRAAIVSSAPTAWLLSTPDPVDIDAARSEQTSRGWRAIPTPVPTPRAHPVKPPQATPEPVRLLATVRSAVHTLLWPLRGPITTYYSAAHPAIDISSPCGTPVKAPAAGAVTWAGWRNNGGGNVVDLDIGWAVVSLNHLSGYAVRSGRVVQGQTVAYVGATGNATGCHLHLEVWVHGRRVNPLLYLP